MLNASGTLDALAAHAVLGDATLGCAAHVTKTITPEPRAGNAAPRIAEVPGGMINSIGLPGPGLARFCREVLPRHRGGRWTCRSWSRSAASRTTTTWRRWSGSTPSREVAALELNLSCPNVKSGCISIGTDPRETEMVTERVRARTSKPVLVKLSPSVADVAELARAAEAGGADALTLTNTARGMVLNRWTGKPLLGAGTGGVSGPALRPQSLAAVATARAAVAIGIVGLGGIETADDARDYLAAGATVVAVGTAIFRDPRTPRRVRDGLSGI